MIFFMNALMDLITLFVICKKNLVGWQLWGRWHHSHVPRLLRAIFIRNWDDAQLVWQGVLLGNPKIKPVHYNGIEKLPEIYFAFAKASFKNRHSGYHRLSMILETFLRELLVLCISSSVTIPESPRLVSKLFPQNPLFKRKTWNQDVKVFGNNKDFLKSLFDLIPEKRSNVYVEAALVLENVSRAVTDKTIRLSEVCDLRKIMSQINKFKGNIIN